MTLQVTYWEDVRDRVAELNPELAKIVDGISPDKRYPLVKMKYYFGQHILDQGHFKVPIDKELKTLDQSGLSSALRHLKRNTLISYAVLNFSRNRSLGAL